MKLLLYFYPDTRNSDEILTLEMKEFFTFVTNDIVATTAFGVEVDSLTHPKNDFYLMGKFVTGISVFRNFIIVCFLLMPRIMKVIMPLHNKMRKVKHHNHFEKSIDITEFTSEVFVVLKKRL